MLEQLNRDDFGGPRPFFNPDTLALPLRFVALSPVIAPGAYLTNNGSTIGIAKDDGANMLVPLPAKMAWSIPNLVVGTSTTDVASVLGQVDGKPVIQTWSEYYAGNKFPMYSIVPSNFEFKATGRLTIDKPNYQKLETVNLTGSSFSPFSTLSIQLDGKEISR